VPQLVRTDECSSERSSSLLDAMTMAASDFLFPSRILESPHISTQQYARVVHRWIASIGRDDSVYGTRTMRRTKASLNYRPTKNLRADAGHPASLLGDRA
jgi:hypothetical protein